MSDYQYSGPLETPGPAAFGATPGFQSAAARSRVKGVVWTLGIVLGLVQLAVPVASVIWIVIVVLQAAFSGPDVEVAHAAWHQGRVWIPQRHNEQVAGKKERRWHLLGMGQAGEIKVDLPAALASESEVRLLTSGAELWVLSAKQRGTLRGGKVELAEEGQKFDPASRPFTLGGRPAVLTRQDRELHVQRLTDARWRDAGSIGLSLPESEYPDDMVVIPGDDVLHVLMKDGDDAVLYGQGKLGGRADQGFSKVTTTDHGFAAGRTRGQLWVARAVDQEEGDRLEVLGQQEHDWRLIASIKGQSVRDLHAIEHGDHATIVVESLLDQVKLVRFDGSRLELTSQTGGGMARVLTWALLPQLGSFGLTLLFALLVALVLRGARVTTYTPQGGAPVEIASLLRRSVARVIDSAILALPLLVAFSWALAGGGTDRLLAVTDTGAQLAYAAWGLLLLGALCAMEGAWAVTPGKALSGIRVLGEDLRPCGFGRALARNLLFAVDGLLSYQVGIMIIALSARQQRLGDQLAKTIVICKGRPE